MDFRSSFRMPGEKAFSGSKPPQAMFKTLRRIHGHNLESQGLNDLTEAFQSFVTRARFFSVGKLRRTWSHSAVEFMKYRRLLPMLLADGQQFENQETDDFNACLSFQATSKDDRKIVVTNVSPRVTPPQLQAFFTQFGKISSCSLPREDGKKQSMYATLQRNTRTCGVATITFKTVEGAQKAKEATPDQLKFYNQEMVVAPFVSRKKGGKGFVLADDKSHADDDRASISSSTQSLASTTEAYLFQPVQYWERKLLSLDDLPGAALERVLAFLPIPDTIRLERVNKRWMETSCKSWTHIQSLSLSRDADTSLFSKTNPLRNSTLRAILSRAGAHLRRLDMSSIVHLLDSKALDIISQHCKNLIELDISGVRANSETLSELSEALPNLRRLSYRDMVSCNDKAFWFLIKGCAKSLKSVDLRGCSRMHGRCLKLFSDNLEQLYLDGCSRVDERAFEDLCTYATGLKELRINDCFLIEDESLSMVARTMSDLNVLTLCGDRFSRLTPTGLSNIANISKLTELALDFNLLVDDSLIEDISSSLHHLTSLSLSNSGTDQSITKRSIDAIAKMTQLEQLDLSSLAAVRSASVSILASSLHHLEVLQLRNCTYLTDEGVQEIPRLLSIKHIDLSGSLLVTANSVQTIIKAFPSTDTNQERITVVVGGTAVDSSALRVRGSRVAINFADLSTIAGIASSSLKRSASMGHSEGEESDDEFESLTAHRSFYMDAVGTTEEDSPMTEKEMLEWAEREAKELGLIK